MSSNNKFSKSINRSYLCFGMMMDPQMEIMLGREPVRFIFELHYLILIIFIFTLQMEQVRKVRRK
jgi:hypothetical protein